MDVPGPERRLAAVLAADMVGYSRLMEADETGTLARLKTHRIELIDPAIAKLGVVVTGIDDDDAVRHIREEPRREIGDGLGRDRRCEGEKFLLPVELGRCCTMRDSSLRPSLSPKQSRH